MTVNDTTGFASYNFEQDAGEFFIDFFYAFANESNGLNENFTINLREGTGKMQNVQRNI